MNGLPVEPTPMRAPTVLVTGAAKRIGRAIAERFGTAGWRVLIHHNASQDEAERVAKRLPNAEAVRFDLADADAVRSTVGHLATREPAWDTLVLSASRFEPDTLPMIDPTVLDSAIAVNLRGNAVLASAFLGATDKRARSRRIVTLLDQKLANMNPDFASYTASKAALATWNAMLAMSVMPNDRVYGLAPGITLPSHDQTEAEFERSAKLNLLERQTMPGEIADAALALATGPFANGSTLFVDSGQHLLRQRRDVMYSSREGIG